jgi:hypothetical protein
MRAADFSRTLLHDFTGCYRHNQRSLVQVLDREFTTPKCREKVNLDVGHEVVIVPFEALVGFLFDNNDDIAWNDTRSLITLAREGDRLATLHALVDVDFEHLLLRDDLTRIASLAFVSMIDDFASPRTLVAWLLQLLDHGPHLAQCHADATTMAGTALLHSTLLPAPPIAL